MANNIQPIPKHVGFILDGNRRWAKERGKTNIEGHRAGHKALIRVTEAAFKKGIKFVTVYVFSTENWNRKAEEVNYLMEMALRVFEKDIARLNKQGIRVLWLGTKDRLSDKHQDAIKKAVELTKNNVKGTLCFCFNYGGTQEIVDGIKKLFQSREDIGHLTPEKFREYLYEPEVPDLDIVVRSSGEERISNFMLWRSAYSEIFFMQKYWPDFDEADIDTVIAEYQKRQRRFGI
jgi:undecaprenyl diphosphate synthase